MTGDLHQGLGNCTILNFNGQRGPVALNGPDAEGVGSVMDRLDIVAHSLGSVELRGLEDGLNLVQDRVNHLESPQGDREAGKVLTPPSHEGGRSRSSDKIVLK